VDAFTVDPETDINQFILGVRFNMNVGSALVISFIDGIIDQFHNTDIRLSNAIGGFLFGIIVRIGIFIFRFADIVKIFNEFSYVLFCG
jgi:hypothetical protein